MRTVFTSESVTEGHPDKVCDQISDAVLDAILAQDPQARVACETCATTGLVQVMGEITTTAHVSIEDIARQVIRDIGYVDEGLGFCADSCAVLTAVHRQSPDIAMGVDRALEGREAGQIASGAGDQGMMFGFACRETDSLMPLPIELAHALAKRLEQTRRTGELPCLLPDGKTQVTVEYEDDRPKRIATVVVSTQHREEADMEALRREVATHVILPTLPKALMDDKTQLFINPTGRFVIGGPAGDSGLTGRKLIVDTYGGYARHGGGALSGKDATKVDRSGAYMARYMAKNIVAAGLADRCEVQLGYSIGLAEPVSVRIDAFGTEKISLKLIRDAVLREVDLRPGAIIQRFGLTDPIFFSVSCYGHFGANASKLPWEKTDLAL